MAVSSFAAGEAPRLPSQCARSRLPLALLLLMLASGGCSVRNYAIDQLGDALAASGGGFAADDDPELIQAAAPFSLKLMESVLSEAPGHAALLTAASSGFTQYAYAFVNQEADESESRDLAAARALRGRARALYVRARDYGLRALDARHAGFRAQLGPRTETALARLSRGDAPALYWTTVAWTAAIALSKDSPRAIADLRPVDLMIERLGELDPDMDHGALHAFLISYEMGRPGARDPEARARRHFEQAVRLSEGQKVGPFVAFAESVCVATQNKREFVARLAQAIAIDPSVRPEWRLENIIMQRRARWLLGQTDQLFLE
jgi:predicted anti-sigma-YlaC factor YlaD